MQQPWWNGAVIYELIVRSYADGNGDGIGDLQGLASRLPYLRWLGVDAIWLTPIYPSPLQDGGYDITDFKAIHPDLGDLAAFHRFLTTAHKHGIKVILDLVLNHTSSLHPWFQRARWAPKGSPERDVYVWSDDPQRYAEAPASLLSHGDKKRRCCFGISRRRTGNGMRSLSSTTSTASCAISQTSTTKTL